MRRFWLVVCLLLVGCGSADRGPGIVVVTDASDFQRMVNNVKTVSFDAFPEGFLLETTLQLDGVSVALTAAGSSPIFGPGPFGFTTNFLSTGVQDGNNNVVITFPHGTKVGGLRLASVSPVSVTAMSAAGESVTTEFSAASAAFLGYTADAGLASITVSAKINPLRTPIVNIGEISYGTGLFADR